MLEITPTELAAECGDSAARAGKSIEVLVIGIGNSLMTDDGAGVHVIERLQAAGLPDHVELIDGGTLGFTLLESVECARRLIVVDAAQLEAAPGVVEVFENAAMDAYLSNCRRSSVHEVNLMDVMSAAKFRGTMPPNYALVGIQPATVDWGSEPTEAVARGVEEATSIIIDMLTEECAA
ncbi:MAG: HyaD/HybD family hydrogenase maturation endopeptidase [Wenzhouxiangella sp.]|jgi:hydrogenase maturation protease|nr:HyaD/HybD family hydrogenase maturation endopeptidase [Wenzhouxiangella sp.]